MIKGSDNLRIKSIHDVFPWDITAIIVEYHISDDDWLYNIRNNIWEYFELDFAYNCIIIGNITLPYAAKFNKWGIAGKIFNIPKFMYENFGHVLKQICEKGTIGIFNSYIRPYLEDDCFMFEDGKETGKHIRLHENYINRESMYKTVWEHIFRNLGRSNNTELLVYVMELFYAWRRTKRNIKFTLGNMLYYICYGACQTDNLEFVINCIHNLIIIKGKPFRKYLYNSLFTMSCKGSIKTTKYLYYTDPTAIQVTNQCLVNMCKNRNYDGIDFLESIGIPRYSPGLRASAEYGDEKLFDRMLVKYNENKEVDRPWMILNLAIRGGSLYIVKKVLKLLEKNKWKYSIKECIKDAKVYGQNHIAEFFKTIQI